MSSPKALQDDQVCFIPTMEQYSTFTFDSYDLDATKGRIVLRYSLDDEVRFEEEITVPGTRYPVPGSQQLDHALFLLHLFGGISYYKTCCPKEIEIRSGELTIAQADFWNTVYTKGLGEFFYRNKVDFRGMVQFPTTNTTDAPFSRSHVHTLEMRNMERGTCKRILLPLGGGKDSIVTLEMLRVKGADITLFRMNTHPLIDEIAKVAGLPLLTVERHLAPELFELSAQGALNGHVPITGYLSALTTVVALLKGFDTVAMSNEASASEGNVEYLGEQINHQWSKSEEFEQMFKDYLSKYVTQNVQFKNPLRAMTEVEISGEFVKHPQYFAHFTSCNRNWKLTGERQKERWCKQCPKCAFAFALLAAYLPRQQLENIFGGNLFEDEQLIPTYKQLLGLEGAKPFECVGTPEETKEAFRRAHTRRDLDNTPAMKLYLSTLNSHAS